MKITVCRKCWLNRTKEYKCTCKKPELVNIDEVENDKDKLIEEAIEREWKYITEAKREIGYLPNITKEWLSQLLRYNMRKAKKNEQKRFWKILTEEWQWNDDALAEMKKRLFKEDS